MAEDFDPMIIDTHEIIPTVLPTCHPRRLHSAEVFRDGQKTAFANLPDELVQLILCQLLKRKLPDEFDLDGRVYTDSLNPASIKAIDALSLTCRRLFLISTSAEWLRRTLEPLRPFETTHFYPNTIWTIPLLWRLAKQEQQLEGVREALSSRYQDDTILRTFNFRIFNMQSQNWYQIFSFGVKLVQYMHGLKDNAPVDFELIRLFPVPWLVCLWFATLFFTQTHLDGQLPDTATAQQVLDTHQICHVFFLAEGPFDAARMLRDRSLLSSDYIRLTQQVARCRKYCEQNGVLETVPVNRPDLLVRQELTERVDRWLDDESRDPKKTWENTGMSERMQACIMGWIATWAAGVPAR